MGNYVPILPANVEIRFSTRRCGGNPGDPYPREFATATATPVSCGALFGTETFSETLLATFHPCATAPTNSTELNTYLKQFSGDYIAWKLSQFDETFNSILDIKQSALLDETIWQWEKQHQSTRIYSQPANYQFQQLGHRSPTADSVCPPQSDADAQMLPYIEMYGPPLTGTGGVQTILSKWNLSLEDGRLKYEYAGVDSYDCTCSSACYVQLCASACPGAEPITAAVGCVGANCACALGPCITVPLVSSGTWPASLEGYGPVPLVPFSGLININCFQAVTIILQALNAPPTITFFVPFWCCTDTPTVGGMSGVLCTIAGQSCITDSTGRCSINISSPGTYAWTATKSRWTGDSGVVTIKDLCKPGIVVVPNMGPPASGYECGPCYGQTIKYPPDPYPDTLHLTDAVYGAVILKWIPAHKFWEGTLSVIFPGFCNIPAQAMSITYRVYQCLLTPSGCEPANPTGGKILQVVPTTIHDLNGHLYGRTVVPQNEVFAGTVPFNYSGNFPSCICQPIIGYFYPSGQCKVTGAPISEQYFMGTTWTITE